MTAFDNLVVGIVNVPDAIAGIEFQYKLCHFVCLSTKFLSFVVVALELMQVCGFVHHPDVAGVNKGHDMFVVWHTLEQIVWVIAGVGAFVLQVGQFQHAVDDGFAFLAFDAERRGKEFQIFEDLQVVVDAHEVRHVPDAAANVLALLPDVQPVDDGRAALRRNCFIHLMIFLSVHLLNRPNTLSYLPNVDNVRPANLKKSSWSAVHIF